MSDPIERAAAVAARAAGTAARDDAGSAFPAEAVEDMREAGLLGLMVPERLGGLGADFEEYVQVAMTLAAGHPALALVFNMHVSVTGALATAPEDLVRALGGGDAFFHSRDRILRAAAGGAFYAVAISETGIGSRLSRVTTTYRRDGDGYRLGGEKSTVSGAGYADAYLVAARDAEADPNDPVVSYFLVPSGPGVDVVGDWDPLGMRATASRGLRLDAHVPAEALLGVPGTAVLLAYVMPQWLVASYAAVYAGLARSLVDHATSWLVERHGPGAVSSAARARLGRADAAAASAALTVEHAARLADRSPADPDTVRWLYRAKLLAGDVAMDVGASLTEACGLSSLRRGDPLERLLRDARLGALMPPRSDLCADYLAALALGLDPATDLEEQPW